MKALRTMAVLSMFAFGASLAQGQMQDGMFMQFDETTDLRSSQLVGSTVYVTELDVTETAVDGTPDHWESVADVSDIVLTRDGSVRGVLIDVGGFLGIGARTVMVSMDSIQLVNRADDAGVFVVFTATREQLENAPEYDMQQTAQGEGVAAPATDPAVASPADPATSRVGVGEPLDGFERVDLSTITVDELTSAGVYDRFNERVSGINDVLLSGDGTSVEAVLIDIGGFLGLGARTVAVGVDQMEILYDAQADDIRVYLNITQDELENLPEYQR
ncbi:hypothetical protein BH23DEI1_BH23DEI1_22180 [soil metagenome]